MKTIIHVNQHNIRRNRKKNAEFQETNNTKNHLARQHLIPVLTCKTYKSNDYGMEAIVKDKDGNEIGRFVYRPETPLSCGAHVWFETENEVEVIK